MQKGPTEVFMYLMLGPRRKIEFVWKKLSNFSAEVTLRKVRVLVLSQEKEVA